MTSEASFSLKKKHLAKLWDKYDKNGDGHLSKTELKAIVDDLLVVVKEQQSRVHEEATREKPDATAILEDLLKHVDTNQDGIIQQEEFDTAFGKWYVQTVIKLGGVPKEEKQSSAPAEEKVDTSNQPPLMRERSKRDLRGTGNEQMVEAEAKAITNLAAVAEQTAPQAKLKLTYFNGRGRAEISRLMLAEAKLVYEDVRIEGKDWAALKANTPYGQMPLLDVNGVTIAQSAAIERYIARTGGLSGHGLLDSARVDMIREAIADMQADFVSANGNKNETEKKTKLDTYFKDTFPRWAAALEKILTANDGGKGYFVGSDVTAADIHFFVVGSMMASANSDAFSASPNLAKLIERVASRERIAAWIKSRPTSPW